MCEEKIGLGFELPGEAKFGRLGQLLQFRKVGYVFESLVDERGFEPPAPRCEQWGK